jgi:threonine dehydrogenase-like Zn-dependent dehydrogenase
VGHIAEKGSNVTNLEPGDRVVVNPNDHCGICHNCRSNLPNHCKNLKAMGVGVDGAFAEYVKTSEKACYPISEKVPTAEAVLAEPLACVINGTGKVKAQPGETAFIIGAGPIGMLFVKMFKAAGVSRIIVSEPSDFRRNQAGKSGADLVLDPGGQDIKRIIRKEIACGPNIVVDAVGSQLAQAIDIIGKRGRLLVIGGKTDAQACFRQIDIVTKEISILGTFLANASFEPAVKILESGQINAGMLVTHTMRLDRIQEGIKLVEQGKTVKVVISPK